MYFALIKPKHIKMNKALIFLLFNFISTAIFGQEDYHVKTDSIEREARKLYRSEMASWYGTDIFLERYRDKVNKSGGYFSYNENNLTRCIFYSKDEIPVVLCDITFDSTYNTSTAEVNATERAFTETENAYYQLRKKAAEIISSDTLFVAYENTKLNTIPIIDDNLKRVYVLTGPQIDGIVAIGNDYLITFDEQNNIIDKKRLHKSYIPINYAKDEKEEQVTVHTHLASTGDFITATDICTLLLYGKFCKWKQHYVISENYVSIWDIKQNNLFVLTKKAWDRIYEDQKKRRGKN